MPTLIDIGSYKGGEIKWGLENGYEVHAFEPNTNCKQYLEQYEDKAIVNYSAAWNEDGFAKLHLMFNPEPGEDGVSLIKEKQNVSQERVTEVPTINMGLYLQNLDKDIDILKINSEGSEYIILESIYKHFDMKRINKIFVEDHANYITSESWEEHKNMVLKMLSNDGIIIKPWKENIYE